MAARRPRSRAGLYLALSLLVSFGALTAVLLTDTRPQLGLDLKGGISVTLTARGEVAGGVLEETRDIIRRRIDALGVAEPEVAIAGDRNIFIQLPGIKNESKAL